MAIQLPNAGLGDGQTGDNEFVMWTKVKDNFSNATHAASKLIGTGAEQVPLSKNIPSLLGTAATRDVTQSIIDNTVGRVMKVGDFGIGAATSLNDYAATAERAKLGYGFAGPGQHIGFYGRSTGSQFSVASLQINTANNTIMVILKDHEDERHRTMAVWHTLNTTVDSNGFIKKASPIVQLFADKIEINDEAQQQNIEFEKLGVGDYLVKGSLGFAQEGWYIEMPKDANGNVLVAVVYAQLENNDLSIKTYDYMLNKKGRIAPDTETPLDIPDGRFISLRLHELPVENVDDIQTEV